MALVIAAQLVIFALVPPATAQQHEANDAPRRGHPDNRRCLQCHAQPHLAELAPRDRLTMVEMMPGEPGADEIDLGDLPPTRPGIFIGERPLAFGVHPDLRCVDCHADATALPHQRLLERPSCIGSCHAQAAAAVANSAHQAALDAGAPDAPTCATCHGGHGVLPSEQRHSMTHPFNAVQVCAECHVQHATHVVDDQNPRAHIEAYRTSVHGRGISEAGLVSAATCADCHGYHTVLPGSDPAAMTSRENIPETCGNCHLGVVETFAESIHGQLLEQGDERAPVCTDCHAEHQISRASVPGSITDIVNECGECHDRPEMAGDRRATFYETYRQSYHGQVNQLGSARAARCSDCHGAHDILPIANEHSRVNPANLIETCGECHEGANANFVKFDPHADYRDRSRYPVLYGVWWYFIIVMSSAFGFFGLHSILWFLRSLRERIKHGPHPRYKANPHGIQRFTAVNRFNHVLVIISFFGLTLTGMPLLFSDQEWAARLADVFGGVVACGYWHRGFAIMLMFNFAVHFYSIGVAFRRRHGSIRNWLFGPNSMVPRKRDIQDVLAMIRWFFVGGDRPTFDRWTYWEKFDYWAEIGGSMIIGGSGLLLWFPEFFSLFLPGWLFNVAMIVHGYEALLAVGFIFTIHFFNAHLRLEKFPVDGVIFTGQMPEEEFKHERGIEYARVSASGELEALKVEPAPAWQYRVAVLVGAIAMLIGISMVALIVLAGLGVL
jgi:cytochrome b subunit of formate dehydrogenase